MKRLVDEETTPDTPERRLTELVRAARRFEPAPFGRQRVLARLTRTQPGGRRILRASIAAAFVLGTVAAAAAIERPWARQGPNFPAGTAAPLPVRQAATARPSALEGPVRAVMQAADAVPAPVSSVDPPRHAAVATRAAPKSPAAPEGRTAAHARPPGEDDPARVLDAIRTLRNGGDATRAAALLDDYLRTHPNGVLSEDALALSIEAADARHDRRAAADYGERYLKQFPAGRFRAIASEAAQLRGP